MEIDQGAQNVTPERWISCLAFVRRGVVDNYNEAENNSIKPNDNLLLAGCVLDEGSMLEVYIYNEEENRFYMHHDFKLRATPMCVEWMHNDSGTNQLGKLCAIGTLHPEVNIMELGVQDRLRLSVDLIGHTSSVMSLSWNYHLSYILASGSVDATVILWDLNRVEENTKISRFQDTVSSLRFHPADRNTLLTGCRDGTVKLFDCRGPNELKLWSFSGSEVERVYWNPHDLNCYYVCLNGGVVHHCDTRQDGNSLWSIQAHGDDVSSILVNHMNYGMVTTTSYDQTLKVWKNNGASQPFLVHETRVGIGKILCGDICYDNGSILAVGGDDASKQLEVIDVRNYEAVVQNFIL